MEYVKIEDSGKRSFGQKKNHTIIFVTGGRGYLYQEEEKDVCTMEDLIFIKPGNKVNLEYRKNKYPLELYVLYVGTELLRSLSDENTKLDERIYLLYTSAHRPLHLLLWSIRQILICRFGTDEKRKHMLSHLLCSRCI